MFENNTGVIRICKSKKNRQHNGQSKEEQTTQWPIEKGQIDKQRSTNHTLKTKDRVTRSPLKTGGELINVLCHLIGKFLRQFIPELDH